MPQPQPLTEDEKIPPNLTPAEIELWNDCWDWIKNRITPNPTIPTQILSLLAEVGRLRAAIPKTIDGSAICVGLPVKWEHGHSRWIVESIQVRADVRCKCECHGQHWTFRPEELIALAPTPPSPGSAAGSKTDGGL